METRRRYVSAIRLRRIGFTFFALVLSILVMNVNRAETGKRPDAAAIARGTQLYDT
jgi:hypothetical protein